MPDTLSHLPAPLEISGEVFLDVFIHKSLGTGKDNRKLAVLGSDVLNLVVNETLYKDPAVSFDSFEAKRKQELDVSKIKTWNAHYNLTSRLIRRNISEPLSDEDEGELFRAYIGAAYLRYGPEIVKKWILGVINPSTAQPASMQPISVGSFRPPISTRLISAEYIDWSMFEDRCRREGKAPKVNFSKEGPAHLLRWRADCEVNGVVKGTGESNSKKEAQKDAIKQAWVACGFGSA